jgi:hypothetical protein
LAEVVFPNHDTVIVLSVESITSCVVWFPAGKVCIVPVQVPANFLDRAGVEADTAPGVAVRSVFGSITRFDFGFADCSGTAVGLSSVIGAGRRCAVMNQIIATSKTFRFAFIARKRLFEK